MSELEYFRVEATLGGVWVDLSDGDYVPAAENLQNSAKSWRKITATHPNLDGDYLVHATLGMVSEQLKIYCYGADMVHLAELYSTLEEIFEQFDYQVRLTFNDFQETWRCQLADYTLERSHVYSHSCMAIFTATVPRFPDVVRESVF